MRFKITSAPLIIAVALIVWFAPIKIFAVPPPSDPTSLTQQEGESGAVQSAGWMSRFGDAIYFKAHMTTPGPSVSLEVETKLVGTAFTGSGTEISSAVGNGMVATIMSDVATNGSYHWRARERYAGSGSATSSWVSFGGNAESAVDFTIDATPPVAPTGPIRTTPSTDTTPTFSWTASVSTELLSYDLKVEQVNSDGSRTSIVSGVIDNLPFSYTVPNGSALAVGNYVFSVRATDNASNSSAYAELVFSITAPADITPPSTPTGLTRATSDSDNTPTFTWNPSTDNVGVTAYEFSIVNISGASQWISATAYTTSDLAIGSYTVSVRARDAAGNISGVSSLSFTIISSIPSADTTSPSAPTGLTRASADTDATPMFTWSASTDNVGVTAYHARIDAGEFIGLGNATSYTTPALSTGTHTIAVRAADAAGNVSALSTISFTIAATATTSGGGTTGGGGSSLVVGTLAGPPFSLTRMETDANAAVQANIGILLSSLGYSTVALCQMDEVSAAARVEKVFGIILDNAVRVSIVNFTSCGSVSALHLGAGERLGVVNSYKSAFGRLPSTSAHWFDVIKIANGRFPGETSASAEAGARARFHTIYLREPNTVASIADTNSVTVMAYGLRPLPRNLSSEAAAIAIFRGIFRYSPTSAIDWDAVRAIAYSGAQR